MITLKLTGIEKITAALGKFPREIARAFQAAGEEAARDEIFPTVGLQQYPPAGPGNQAPAPFYVRGRGTQYASGKNDGRSERYGTQFYVTSGSTYTELGNRSSYAPYLADADRQSRAMARIGWRTLVSVITEKLPQITAIYQAWLNKTIRDLNL